MDRGDLKLVCDKLHCDIVGKVVGRSSANRVLGVKPPPVHKNELDLPRVSRTVLSQLRSGHCARLRDFQLKLGKATDGDCPNCNLDRQDVAHIFDCPAKPTTLRIEDLWENPWGVADHLRTLPEFKDLPPPAQPAPAALVSPQRPPARPPDSPVFSPLSLRSFTFSPPPSPDLFSSLNNSLSPLAPLSQDPRHARSD